MTDTRLWTSASEAVYLLLILYGRGYQRVFVVFKVRSDWRMKKRRSLKIVSVIWL